MPQSTDQNSSVAPSPGRRSDSFANMVNCVPPHNAALSTTFKQTDGSLDLEDIDRQLDALKEMQISESTKQVDNIQKDGQDPHGNHKDGRGPPHREGSEDIFHREQVAVNTYFFQNCSVALELQELRLKGWNSTEGDEYFKKQKWHTDNADRHTSQKFMGMMCSVADKMEMATGVFTLPSPRPTILAFGFAPGGFVQKALKLNPNAQAIGITLSDKFCGIPILVKDKRLIFHPADITLMAGDMGMLPDEIPPDHPDAENFLPKLIRPRATFDLVTAEGGVLRPHQSLLGSHRELREAHRLKASQLALAVSRVKRGGRMIVLLHKPETWNSLSLFYTFSKFAKIQLFKPSQQHQYKSSFYMIALDVQSQSEAARTAVQRWTREWKVATFGTNEEYEKVAREHALDVDQVLEEFGQEWLRMSEPVWQMQRDGLKEKSFTQD